MATSMPVGFDSWLSLTLKELNADENVFGSYIKGILEGEESQDEKMEALEGILVEMSPVHEPTNVKVLLSFRRSMCLFGLLIRATVRAKMIFVKRS